ncbi:MAG: hypothetical protein JRJ20_06100 [Deltaproteobacteria bacterium]|nr:hypothetical protein [Deltaproteobacteria bacterium]
MKKIILTTFFVFVCVFQAFGDEVDEGLPNMATVALKTGTRHMIRAGIDSEDAIRMTRAMLENRFKHEHILKAQEIVMRSRKEGLPVEPIMNKAHEGMAKRVQEENIIRAMENVMARYGYAYQQAGELTQDEAKRQRIMEQVAECVAAGMTDSDAGRLVYRLKYRIQEMPEDEAGSLAIETFSTGKEIARLRVSSMVTTDLMLEALKHHYGIQEMARMRLSFMKHSRDTSPNIVAQGYSDAIHLGKRLEGLDFLRARGTGKGSLSGGSAGSGRGSGGTAGSSHGGGSGESSGRGSGGSRGGR